VGSGAFILHVPDVAAGKSGRPRDLYEGQQLGFGLAYRVALFAELAFAYVHLGLLITVLDRKISRRAP
jgi:hypothetical protein